LDYGTSPQQLVRAQVIQAVLAVWETSVDGDEKFVASVMLKAVSNLCFTYTNVERMVGTPAGRVHFAQVLSYAVDQGYELQLRGDLLVPVFPNQDAWTTLATNMLQAVAAITAQAGYPVHVEEPLPADLFAGIRTQLTRKELNEQLLQAEFPRLELLDFNCLEAETVFTKDRYIMCRP
jgi:hypothetical protein